MSQVDSMFVSEFRNTAEKVHNTAIDKGWWGGSREDGTVIALMHSELSEALEWLRRPPEEVMAARLGHDRLRCYVPSDHIPGFAGVEEELADVLIRIMDYATQRGMKLAEAVEAKMEFNRRRPMKHGGKKF